MHVLNIIGKQNKMFLNTVFACFFCKKFITLIKNRQEQTMGNFVNVVTEGVKKYIGLTDKPFSKIFSIERKLSLHRFSYEGKSKKQIVYYDTHTNLLEKAGIILSKTYEPNRCYFKVERQTYFPKTFSRRKEVVFIHEVGPKDSVIDHAFFLSDGIKSLFTIQFTIDLDNVLKNVVPKIVINSKVTIYNVLSGGGFKAKLFMQENKIKNLTTKRIADAKTLVVELDSPTTYLPAFKYFTEQIDKYCKELIPFEESLYDYSHRVTKPLPEKTKITKQEKQKLKQKQKKVDDIIVG
jgi:hypothetical protein